MKRRTLAALILGAALSITASLPAMAGPVSFVSATGKNTGACNKPGTACRTLQFAFNQTLAGGQINVLTPGNYGTLTINKEISIVGVPGAGIVLGVAGTAITVSAGTTDSVNIVGLTLDGLNKAATEGIQVASAGELTIRNCEIRAFSSSAINLIPGNDMKFLIEDTVVAGNGNEAIRVRAPGFTVKGTLNRVSSVNNGFAGMRILNGGKVAVSDSVFSGNASDGILVGAATGVEVGGELRIGRTTISGNGDGLRVLAGSTVESAGDNLIRGNSPNIVGTVTNVGGN